jgi:6-phosphofructokinase
VLICSHLTFESAAKHEDTLQFVIEAVIENRSASLTISKVKENLAQNPSEFGVIFHSECFLNFIFVHELFRRSKSGIKCDCVLIHTVQRRCFV